MLDMPICRDSEAFELGRSQFMLINDGDCMRVYILTGYGVSEILQGQLKTIVERYQDDLPLRTGRITAYVGVSCFCVWVC